MFRQNYYCITLDALHELADKENQNLETDKGKVVYQEILASSKRHYQHEQLTIYWSLI